MIFLKFHFRNSKTCGMPLQRFRTSQEKGANQFEVSNAGFEKLKKIHKISGGRKIDDFFDFHWIILFSLLDMIL